MSAGNAPDIVTVIPGPQSGRSSFQPQSNSFEFGPWIITTKKSHILQSKCKIAERCSQEVGTGKHPMCSFCRFEKELPHLSNIPEMVFADNVLRIEHKQSKFGLEFNALDALKLAINTSQECLKVANADAWREARADSEHIKDVKPFNWTFTTNYTGSLFGKDEELQVTPTTQRIDMERLKRKEKILFYDDLHLFEDELADNGCAFLSVKIRAMPSGFFILQRFYLRIDNVLVRVHDTRLHYTAETNYILREYSRRESSMSELEKLPPSVILDPNEVYQHLKLKEEIFNKMNFPL